MSSTKRIYYYDVLNVVSCASVIALHCNGYVHRFDVADRWWWLHVLFEVAFYNSVPIFFMLSGATLLGYRQKYDTRTFFRKRFKKAFVPFLVFSVLFYAFAIVFTRHPDLSLTTVVYNVATGHIPFTDYWFFVPLFILYLFMPFLSVMVAHLSNRQLLALILLIVAMQSVCEPVIALVGAEWKLPMGSYVAYLFLGYYLSKTDWEKDTRVVTALAVAGLLFMSLRYAGIYTSDHRIPQFWTYLSLYGFTASAAIFLIVKRLAPAGGRIIRFLSRRSYGVYLIQRFVINITAYFLIPTDNPLLVALFPVVYLVCVIAVYVLQQFRWTRWLVPG